MIMLIVNILFKIYVYLCILFNTLMIHGSHVPSKLMETILISLVKDKINKKGNVTDKDNYHPIAITRTVSKIF